MRKNPRIGPASSAGSAVISIICIRRNILTCSGSLRRFIECAIPLWNTTLTALRNDPRPRRITPQGIEYDPGPDEISESEWPQREEGEDDDDFQERSDEWRKTLLVQPEPEAFEPPIIPKYKFLDEISMAKVRVYDSDDMIDLYRDYAGTGLQVIVKLANIHLTPEKPRYDGGSWHVEGQMVSSSAYSNTVK